MTAGGDGTERSGDDGAPGDSGDSTTESLSWNVGPGDSRTIRVCYYLFEAFAGGAVLAGAFEYGRAFLPAALASNPWAPAALSLAALALAWRCWRWLLARAGRPANRTAREWLAVRRWWLSLAAATPVAVALVALERSLPRPHWSGPYSTWFVALFVAVAFAWLTELLSAARANSTPSR
ncbi:hypothetical protein ACFO3H_18010 [Halorussus sp. GCM10023401]|nr:hypothetical protein [Halorussus vallis]USZ75431.1 hypothetical protein NGM07_18605 [Halorussus vallis]